MNKSRKNTLIIDGIVGMVIAIFIVQCAIPSFGDIRVPYEDTRFESPAFIENIPIPQEDDFSLLEVPFYSNLTDLSNWLKYSILDAQTDPSISMPYYGSTNRNGSQVLDKNHYFEDYLVYLDGLIDIIPEVSDDLSKYVFFSHLIDSKFYDINSPNGYYSSINENRTINSGIKEFDDNVQILLTFTNWAITSLDTQTEADITGFETILTSAWNQLESNFLDTTAAVKSFNHTSDDSEKYVRDQLMAAIAGFQLCRADQVQDTNVRQKANNTATDLMKYMLNESLTHDIFDNDQKVFSFKRNSTFDNEDPPFGYDRKELETNAYGIWALCEYYLQSNKQKPEALSYAEGVFQFLEKLWNGTAKLYSINGTNFGDPSENYNMGLKDNGIMLSALARLFEISGNFTYFERIMEIYTGIRDKLYDEMYGNYYTSYDPILDSVDDTKNLKSHAYLFRAYKDIAELSNYVSTSIDINSTTVIKNVNAVANVSLGLKMKSVMNYTLSDGSNIYYTKNINISNPSFFLSIRYPNGTVLNSVNVIGDKFGNTSVPIFFPESIPTGEYTLAMSANYTGFYGKFNFSSIYYISGIHGKNYEWSSDKIYPGESYSLNLTLNSSRYDNITFDLKCKSDILDSDLNIVNQNITNGTIKSYNLSIPISSLAKINQTTMNISLVRNNIIYETFSLDLEVKSPVEVLMITQDDLGFQNYSFNAQVKLRSVISKPMNCSLTFNGESFLVMDSKTVEIPAGSDMIVQLSTTLNRSTPLGNSIYEINITRTIDSEMILSQNLNFEVKNKFEIIEMNLPISSVQWEKINAQLIIQNNLPTTKSIIVEINGKNISTDIMVTPGMNIVSIPIESLWNPYSLGQQYYDIQIYDYEGNLIYQSIMNTKVTLSIGSLIVGYIIPIIIPLIGIVVFRHKELENKKRLI